MGDNVNHPEHYMSESGIEVIDVIDAFTEDLEGPEAVYTANVIKYICRWKKKNGLEDLEKAKWYLDRLICRVKNEDAEDDQMFFVLGNNDGKLYVSYDDHSISMDDLAVNIYETLFRKEND